MTELTDDEIKLLARESFDCTWDPDDETLVNKYGHGTYFWRFAGFARAIIAAHEAKRVPMTVQQWTAEVSENCDIWAFEAGIRAAEAHHGIGVKT